MKEEKNDRVDDKVSNREETITNKIQNNELFF